MRESHRLWTMPCVQLDGYARDDAARVVGEMSNRVRNHETTPRGGEHLLGNERSDVSLTDVAARIISISRGRIVAVRPTSVVVYEPSGASSGIAERS